MSLLDYFPPYYDDLYVQFGEFREFPAKKLFRNEFDGLPCAVEGYIPIEDLTAPFVTVVAPYCGIPGNRYAFRLSKYHKVWKFPRERFVTYEPKDVSWCRQLGIGEESSARDGIDAEVVVESFELSVYDRYTALLRVNFNLCVWTPATLTTVVS